MFKKLIPAIFGWLTVVITLALAPTIETYVGHVTSNVTGATNASYMIGMTAIDDFAGFLMIISLLLSTGFFAVTGMQMKNTTVGDMLKVIGAVILAIISLAIYSGSVIGYFDALITAGSGFAKTAYGVLTTIVFVGIIGGASAYVATKTWRRRKGRRASRSAGRYS